MNDLTGATRTPHLVVLSGGQDSTTCLFWALRRSRGAPVRALVFDYGQRHSAEIAAAHIIAARADVPLDVCRLGSKIMGGRSPLTNPEAELETYPDHDTMERVIGNRVEKTFVPMRNALFLTVAANRAICSDIYNIVTGVCQEDNANYPDCRRTFILSQEETINQALGLAGNGTGGAIEIHTPLMDLSKQATIALALALPGCYAALAYSHTAYDGQFPPVSKDHASILRAHGFVKAGVPDPLVLRAYYLDMMDLPETENYRGLPSKGPYAEFRNYIGLIEADLPSTNWGAWVFSNEAVDQTGKVLAL